MPKQESEKSKFDCNKCVVRAFELRGNMQEKAKLSKTKSNKQAFNLAVAVLDEVIGAGKINEVQTCQEEEKQEVGSATSAEQ